MEFRKVVAEALDKGDELIEISLRDVDDHKGVDATIEAYIVEEEQKERAKKK